MNKQKFVSDIEVKLLLGITGTNLDAAIELYNQAANNVVCDILKTHEIMTFDVVDELVVCRDEQALTPKYLPIDWTTSPVVKDLAGTEISDTLFRDIGEIRTIRRKNSSGLRTIFSVGYSYLVSYTAGYSTQADVPTELKQVAALIVQAAILKVDRANISKLGGNDTVTTGSIKKYEIGGKTVEYFDPGVKRSESGYGASINFEATINEWAARFKKFQGFS